MDCYFDEVEYETGELLLLETVRYGVKAPRCVPVVDLQPGMFIHHTATVMNTGTFEVISVKVFDNGAVSVRVKMTSVTGNPFVGKLPYMRGDMVEVVER